MDLLVHEVDQLQHVDVANCDRGVERLAGAAVEQDRLAVVLDHPLPVAVGMGVPMTFMISSSRAPSNTGVAVFVHGLAPTEAGLSPSNGSQPWDAAHPR
jgi:hypothetical protein